MGFMLMSEAEYERIELRYTREEGKIHYVDVPHRAASAACGTTVDSFSQWRKVLGNKPLVLCFTCVQRLPRRYA